MAAGNLVGINVHNAVVVTGLVLLVFFLMAKAKKTALGNVPVLGQILSLTPVSA